MANLSQEELIKLANSTEAQQSLFNDLSKAVEDRFCGLGFNPREDFSRIKDTNFNRNEGYNKIKLKIEDHRNFIPNKRF